MNNTEIKKLFFVSRQEENGLHDALQNQNYFSFSLYCLR